MDEKRITPDEAIAECLNIGAQGISLGLAKQLQAERDALSRENAELRAALEAAKADMEEARAKSDCGHPSECMVQEQGREDFDETCLWCAQLAAADQVAEYEKGLALESSRQREAALIEWGRSLKVLAEKAYNTRSSLQRKVWLRDIAMSNPIALPSPILESHAPKCKFCADNSNVPCPYCPAPSAPEPKLDGKPNGH